MCANTTEVCDSGPFLGSSFRALPLCVLLSDMQAYKSLEAVLGSGKPRAEPSGSSATPSPLASALLRTLDVALSHMSGCS